MESEGNTPKSKIVQELPKLGATFLLWQGRKLPMAPQSGGWRVRSRSSSFPVDLFFATPSLVEAKRLAKEKLAHRPADAPVIRGTLENVISLYLTAPKRCSQHTAEGNISRLRGVAREAFGKTLDQVTVRQIPEMWPAYVAARQGLKQPDYATRRPSNAAINSAMLAAGAVFLPALRPYYQRHGIDLPAEATNIMRPAAGQLDRIEVDDRAMIRAWVKLRHTNVDLWLTVGLARFAGLRQSEIFHCRGKWIRDTGTHIEMRDRPEDEYFSKTGKRYSALILSRTLADYLLAVEPDSNVIVRPGSHRWLQRTPQVWLRQFMGDSKAPLHRLRGLYADHVKRITEQAILARAGGLSAASKALGHTSTRTTEKHYTTPDQ